MHRLHFKPALIAIAIALLLGGVAAFAVSTIYRAALDAETQDELVSVGGRTIADMEAQIDSGVATLLDLALSGKMSCAEANVLRLRSAVFTSPVVKSIALAGLDGAVNCSTAVAEGFISATSPEFVGRDANVKFAATELTPGVRALQLRIRIDESAQLLVASMPIAALISGRLTSKYADAIGWSLRLGEGTVLARLESEPGITDRYEVIARSGRYPIAFEMMVPRAAVYAKHASRESWLMAAAGSITTLAILLGVAFYARLSERDSAVIRQTLRRGRVVPLFQPIFSIATGELLGAEVLIRWRMPDGRMVPPAKIIDQIEHTGEIFPVTRTLLAAARDAMADLYATRPELRLSFNMVPDHFRSLAIVKEIQSIFGGSGFAYSQIVLELTERRPLADFDQARVVIDSLHALGCRIALDDVGTGHAGLSYVLKLEADIIKIDKFFIDALELETASAPIIDMLVDLSRRIGMTVVAEGVETMAQLNRLSRLGVDAAQGYLFAKPLPASAYRRLIEAMIPIAKAGREAERTLPAGPRGLREVASPKMQPDFPTATLHQLEI